MNHPPTWLSSKRQHFHKTWGLKPSSFFSLILPPRTSPKRENFRSGGQFQAAFLLCAITSVLAHKMSHRPQISCLCSFKHVSTSSIEHWKHITHSKHIPDTYPSSKNANHWTDLGYESRHKSHPEPSKKLTLGQLHFMPGSLRTEPVTFLRSPFLKFLKVKLSIRMFPKTCAKQNARQTSRSPLSTYVQTRSVSVCLILLQLK